MNAIGRFTKNIMDSVADAGVSFLNFTRLQGSATQILLDLCDDLVSHKGVASGIALAREVVHRYNKLSINDKLIFFKELNKNMNLDYDSIKSAAETFTNSPNEKNLVALSTSLKSKRQKLFSRMNMAPEGTKAIVNLRDDLLQLIPTHSELSSLDEELRAQLTSWFNPGFLVLKRINWETEASILEKIILYESVHTITDWNDLKSRLSTNKRCFAYFHPALDDEPLIFVEIALTKGISRSIQSIIKEKDSKVKQADTAIFYSINNCQRGLKKVPLGNFLIKMVVTELAKELPSIKKYSTLSPIPGFATWLNDEIKKEKSKFLSKTDVSWLASLKDKLWYKDPEKVKKLKPHLTKACAIYLLKAKRYDKPINAVARFHFGNGAKLYQINFMGNTSEYGITKSFGLMVNYLYELKSIEANHEAYVKDGELAVSKSVKKLLG